MSSTKKTPFTVSILQPAIAGQPSVYRLQYDGHTLYPDLYRDWISAAYLLKGCEPAADTIGNFAVWRQWASQSSVKYAHDIDQAARIWAAVDPHAGAKQAADDVKAVMGPAPERHPVQLVVKISHDKCDPKPITLFVEDLRPEAKATCRQLDPNIHDDIEMAIYCLKSKGLCCSPMYKVQADGFKLLNEWYGQAESQVEDLVLLSWWESVLPPDVAAPEPVQSSRSRIGQILDRFTQSVSEATISGQTLVVQNLTELQQQLADLVETLITERIGQQQVLKARGATVLDCHQLGLLSDDDMANHMADCLMVILGKPVGAKAAKAVILAAAGHVRDEPPIDFNQDVILQPPPREVTNIGWEKPVRVSFDGAEGQGRVWLHVDHEHDEDEPAIAVPGVDNARHLAKLLNAWADDYNPKSEQPQ